jgi:RNA polymerase sigma-B factor
MSESLSWYQDPEGLVMRYMEDPRPDLKDLVLIQYGNMVERIARKFSGIEPLEDLLQVGYIGLLNALSKFDPSAGVRFNTYATYLVAGEIKHYLRDRAQTIRQPAWLQELRHKVRKSAGLLQQELGRVPTEREIAENIGVSEQSVREVFQTENMLRVDSLDATAQGDDEANSEVDKLDASSFCPEQLSMEDRLVLEGAMKQLRDLERQVLVHFHFDAMNQTEIAAKLGISCNYVSHILRQSLAKLRKILSAEEEKDRLLRCQADALDYEIIDPATGAYTEACFRARLEEDIHRASSTGDNLAIVLVEFKSLEAMRKFYGEQSVQDFLADAAEFFRGSVRRLDIVARYGETGFAILLPETGPNAELVRRRLMTKLENWMNHRVVANGSLEVHLGQAVFPDQGRNAAEILQAASPQSLDGSLAA